MTAFLVCAHAFMTTAEVSFHIADLFYIKQQIPKTLRVVHELWSKAP